MNSVENIFDFIIKDANKAILINQVTEEICFFYVGLIEYFAGSRGIKLNFNEGFVEEKGITLFEKEEIDLYFSSNKKNIEKYINSKSKCIIFTDYKNYKTYLSSELTINGYNYQKDIEYFIRKVLQINNLEIVDFCLSTPYLTFSETSKYLINSSKYMKENTIKGNDNFILNLRKELFNLKRNQASPQEIFINLKQEVKYKKFNFLTY